MSRLLRLFPFVVFLFLLLHSSKMLSRSYGGGSRPSPQGLAWGSRQIPEKPEEAEGQERQVRDEEAHADNRVHGALPAGLHILPLRDARSGREEPPGPRPDRGRRRFPHPEDGEGLRREHKIEENPSHKGTVASNPNTPLHGRRRAERFPAREDPRRFLGFRGTASRRSPRRSCRRGRLSGVARI